MAKTTPKKRGKKSEKVLIEDLTLTTEQDGTEKFDFGEKFQRLLVKEAIENPEWYINNKPRLKPEYFEVSELVHIVSIIHKFSDQYDTAPSYEVLEDIITDSYSEDVRAGLIIEVDEVKTLSVEPAEVSYSLTRMENFTNKQFYTKAITDASSAIEMQVFTEVPKIFDKTLSIIEKPKFDDSFYFEDKNYEDRYNLEKVQLEKIPTLFPTVDEYLRGGLSKTELGIMMAPPNRGKSASLVQLGTNALFSGKNVWHVSVEMNKTKVEYRYDSCLTALTYDAIIRNVNGFNKKRMEFSRLYRGKLKIDSFPARSLTVRDLKEGLRSLHRRFGFKVDLLVLDYIDELKRPTGQANTSYAVGEVVAEARGLCEDMDIACWTATQTTRAGLSKVTLDMDDVADSWEKAKVSDVIIAHCQTKEEEEKEEQRWIFVKNRNNKRISKPIKFKTNFNIFRYKEI